MSIFTDLLSNPNVILTLKFVYYTAPFWVTAILAVLFWEMLITYKRTKFFAKQNFILLEIKLPKEILKSPASMEFFYNAICLAVDDDPYTIKLDRWPPKVTSDFWKGSVRPWFSLELCAINGKLHFFIWTNATRKTLIEAQLYSQFPGIEIYEVPDYTLPVAYDPEKMKMWITEFKLAEPDAFPIKTYIDYGMDKDPEEEYKIDPMTPLIEYLTSLPPEHQVWIQIIITAHKKEDKGPDGKKIDKKWKNDAEIQIQKIWDKAKPPKPEDGSAPLTFPRILSKGETETISALERSVSKKAFDVGMRAVYFAPKDLFSLVRIGGIVAGIYHFNSNLNGFKTVKFIDLDWEKQRMFYAYKNRGYFWNEFKHNKPFILNTEELATLYHFPSSGGENATSPFERVGSKKSGAPSNLPI